MKKQCEIGVKKPWQSMDCFARAFLHIGISCSYRSNNKRNRQIFQRRIIRRDGKGKAPAFRRMKNGRKKKTLLLEKGFVKRKKGKRPLFGGVLAERDD